MVDRELDVQHFPGENNSLSHKPHGKNLFKKLHNLLALYIGLRLPFQMKNRLVRRTGVKLGENVYIGFKAYLDVLHPEKISIGDNTIIGGRSIISAHEATQDEYRTGEVKIGKDVLIGANCMVLPGVEIGDGATIAAHSLVNRDVDEGEFVGGVPIETIKNKPRT